MAVNDNKFKRIPPRRYDKSIVLRETAEAKAEKTDKARDDLIKKQDTKIKQLELQIKKMMNILKNHNSKLINLKSEMFSHSNSIDNIKRAMKK